VDKYSTIVIDQNRYSVPDYLVGEVVRMKVYSDSIQCFYHEEKIATHCRKTGNQEWEFTTRSLCRHSKEKAWCISH
jgi:hypothetical protein